ncbi:murein hydrolase activator EnvC [Xenophilus sp. Marseille-Q4582]|uniref:murein hydrolase activator EnvC family protein n=1 Tax=Xenophilus sp. Marseille-Q4582 TaxID=2866600 RepID=UPI00351DA049
MAGLGSALLLGACGTTDPSPGPAAPPSPRTASTPPQASSKRPVPPAPAPAPAPVDARFGWPAKGPVVGRFDGNRNKGIDIGGQTGDPILASADGRVVFVGSQLRGYGQMVIVKHDDTFITAYAHTSRILVKEKDDVRKGQKIAEMGSSGTDRVKLHFEIRRQGVAVNPQPYLDGRQR